MSLSDPTATRMLVYHVVVNYFALKVHLPSEQLDISRTFKGAAPQGYGQTPGAFLAMCSAITPELQHNSGRALALSDDWRLAHGDDTIAAFVNAVAIEVLTAPLTPTGQKALSWVIGN